MKYSDTIHWVNFIKALMPTFLHQMPKNMLFHLNTKFLAIHIGETSRMAELVEQARM